MIRCSECKRWFGPKRRDAVTCSRYCANRRRARSGWERPGKKPDRYMNLYGKLPAGMPVKAGPNHCQACDSQVFNGTDGDGALVLSCQCDHGRWRYVRKVWLDRAG